jgi:hypothetical protein
MDAVEEASGRVERSGIERERAFDRLGGLGLGCHLQARLLCRQLVLTETLAGAPEAQGSFLESASACGRVVFGELLQQLHVNGRLSVGSCSWVWDLCYVCAMLLVVGMCGGGGQGCTW